MNIFNSTFTDLGINLQITIFVVPFSFDLKRDRELLEINHNRISILKSLLVICVLLSHLVKVR